MYPYLCLVGLDECFGRHHGGHRHLLALLTHRIVLQAKQHTEREGITNTSPLETPSPVHPASLPHHPMDAMSTYRGLVVSPQLPQDAHQHGPFFGAQVLVMLQLRRRLVHLQRLLGRALLRLWSDDFQRFKNSKTQKLEEGACLVENHQRLAHVHLVEECICLVCCVYSVCALCVVRGLCVSVCHVPGPLRCGGACGWIAESAAAAGSPSRWSSSVQGGVQTFECTQGGGGDQVIRELCDQIVVMDLR